MGYEVMKSKQDKDLKGTVTKSNLLVLRSKYQLSGSEDRILRYIVSQLPVLDADFIESVEKDADKGDYRHTPVVNISIQDYVGILDVSDDGRAYDRVKRSIITLGNKSVWVEDPNRPGGEVTAGWIMRSRIDKGSGNIEVVIDPYILRYIRGLKEKFISYRVESSIRMKSIYSRMLYDVIMTESWKDGDEHIISIEDLRRYLQLADDEYLRFNNLRVRCIEPAVEDIRKHVGIDITCDYVMKGRKCQAVRFIIKGVGKPKKSKGKKVDFSDPGCKYECEGQESLDMSKLDPDKPKRKPRKRKTYADFEQRTDDLDAMVERKMMQRMRERMRGGKE